MDKNGTLLRIDICNIKLLEKNWKSVQISRRISTTSAVRFLKVTMHSCLRNHTRTFWCFFFSNQSRFDDCWIRPFASKFYLAHMKVKNGGIDFQLLSDRFLPLNFLCNTMPLNRSQVWDSLGYYRNRKCRYHSHKLAKKDAGRCSMHREIPSAYLGLTTEFSSLVRRMHRYRKQSEFQIFHLSSR